MNSDVPSRNCCGKIDFLTFEDIKEIFMEYPLCARHWTRHWEKVKTGLCALGVCVLVGELENIPVSTCITSNAGVGEGAVGHGVAKEWHLSRCPRGEKEPAMQRSMEEHSRLQGSRHPEAGVNSESSRSYQKASEPGPQRVRTDKG